MEISVSLASCKNLSAALVEVNADATGFVGELERKSVPLPFVTTFADIV